MNCHTRELGRALSIIMHRLNLTHAAVGASAGMPQSVVSRYISGQRRPEPAALRALTHAPCWAAQPRAGLQIMLGHLRDELARADWSPSSILMRARGDHRRPLRALHEIEESIQAGDDDVAALIEHVADLLRRARVSQASADDAQPLPMAAETAGDYGADCGPQSA